MEIIARPYRQIPFLSPADLAYLEQQAGLMQFAAWLPELDVFKEVIPVRAQQFSLSQRQILCDTLVEQYRTFSTSQEVLHNIQLLNNQNTFTVCTAHQPSIFTGPLFVIFKIASCINLARQLSQAYPYYHFVPVYVMGGEDHDFDEINHLHIWGNKFEWQHEDKGYATGRLSTAGLQQVWENVMKLLDTKLPANKLNELFTESYSKALTHGEGNLRMIDALFRQFGLVTISMDHKKFKASFVPIMEDDLIRQSSAQIVRGTQAQLAQAGYSAQAHVRDVNLFLFKDKRRQRIEKVDHHYEVGGEKFEAEVLVERLHQHPEDFSPNVVLRPLLQEQVLPNLAYVGGGGEIAYWLERKAQFAHYDIPYPALIRRNSAAFIDKVHEQALIKSGLDWPALCTPDIEAYLRQRAADSLDFNLNEQIIATTKVYDHLANQVSRIDPTLEPFVLAEKVKAISGLQQIEKKAIKAEKGKQDLVNNRIRKVYTKVFPNQNLQERVENYLPYYLEYGPNLTHLLVEKLDPFRREFLFFVDKD